MRVLDLFSGIGGFSLGLERAGMETVAFCEQDEFCQKVLAKHWPDIPIHDDVRTLDGTQYRGSVDVICGGFPCQDISYAGPGEGLDGARSGLWDEYKRIIGEVDPEFVCVENVAALLNRGLGRVLGDLATLGFDSEWHCIPASYVGCRQLRDRVWIVAYAQRLGIQGRQVIAQGWCKESRAQQLARLLFPPSWPSLSAARACRNPNGLFNRIHRNKALGNAVVPQIPEIIGRAIMEAA